MARRTNADRKALVAARLAAMNPAQDDETVQEAKAEADAKVDDFDNMSKAELYDIADEVLDIPGRSGMNKSELLEAVKKAAE